MNGALKSLFRATGEKHLMSSSKPQTFRGSESKCARKENKLHVDTLLLSQVFLIISSDRCDS